MITSSPSAYPWRRSMIRGGIYLISWIHHPSLHRSVLSRTTSTSLRPIPSFLCWTMEHQAGRAQGTTHHLRLLPVLGVYKHHHGERRIYLIYPETSAIAAGRVPAGSPASSSLARPSYACRVVHAGRWHIWLDPGCVAAGQLPSPIRSSTATATLLPYCILSPEEARARIRGGREEAKFVFFTDAAGRTWCCPSTTREIIHIIKCSTYDLIERAIVHVKQGGPATWCMPVVLPAARSGAARPYGRSLRPACPFSRSRSSTTTHGTAHKRSTTSGFGVVAHVMAQVNKQRAGRRCFQRWSSTRCRGRQTVGARQLGYMCSWSKAIGILLESTSTKEEKTYDCVATGGWQLVFN